MAYDEDLADRIRALLATDHDVVEKKMFGGLAFLIGGNMSVSASGQGGMLLRCDPDETDALVREPHAARFEMRGRAMDGWLRVQSEGLEGDAELKRWVGVGVDYARRLPRRARRRMLVTRRQGGLCLITHPEHGRVAGELSRRWGNEQFEAPAHQAALIAAATYHDDGWYELDGRPSFNAEAARPAHFLELPLEVTVGPYGRGVDSVYARDRHAGALVSMHWAGLYHTRFGLHGGEPVSHPLAVEVVAEQDHRRAAALRDAWGGHGRRSEFEHQTWYAYELLQALDLMSLALGLVDTGQPMTGGDSASIFSTLARIDQPPGMRSIPVVPVAPGGPYLTLTLRVREPGEVAVDPYPFSETGFEIELSARLLEDRRYDSAEEAASAYHRAEPQTTAIRFVPGGSR